MARLIYKLSALDPFDPEGIQTRTIGLEQSQMDALLHAKHRVKLARLTLAKEVTEDPGLVFENWMRPEQEDGLCYAGRPQRDCPDVDIETPAPPEMVFLVFTKPSGKMTDWRWERSDRDDPDYPEAWRDRFGRIVWPITPSI